MKYQKHLDIIERTTAPHVDDNKIRLHAAERNQPWSDKIWQKYIANLKESDIRCYPDQFRAVERIAQHERVKPNQITIGNGSDQVIKNIFECFAIPGSNVVTTNPCFPMYNVYGAISNVQVVSVPYKDKKADIEGLIDSINHDTSIVIISNPSSPVGDTFSPYDLQGIINKAYIVDAVVVIDEAYIEFSDCKSLTDTLGYNPNIIVTKTFSKALGSAGMRFGYSISNVPHAMILSKVKNIYEITGPTLKWIETVLDNYEDVIEYTNSIKYNRLILTEQLSKYYEVVPGQCNWIHTTKIDFPYKFTTRQCTLPWSTSTWTRLCIPGDYHLISEVLQRLDWHTS